MHPAKMLLEIIQTRPLLLGARAVPPKTHIHHLGTALRFLLMDAFLVACQVIDGSESFFAWTVWLVAFEELAMACFVFPVPSQVSFHVI